MNNPMQIMQGNTQNPFFRLVQVARRGGDPMQMLQQMAGSDPRAVQAIKLLQGKSAQELQQIATNMARDRGVSPEDIAKSLGLL